MATPSPICTVKDGASAPQATTNGTVATAGNLVTIALASTAGVNSWSPTLYGQDESISPPTLTINNTLKTATFTAPTLPWSLIYKSTVNGGVDVNGVTQASYSTTFKICCLTASGKRLAASNETTENNSTTGWTSILNDHARNPTPAQAALPISATTIDWSLSGVFTKTISGDTTFTFSNATSGMVIVVRVTTTGANVVTWPTVRWAAGTPPTQTATGTDVYTFVHDGTNIYGSVVQAMA